METSKIQPTIDWNTCLQLSNNNAELAHELLTMFVNELPAAKAAINTALKNKDYRSLQWQVHKLHGASCYCGVPYLKQLAQQLETVLKTAQHQSIKELTQSLTTQMQLVVDNFNEGAFQNS